MLTTPAKLLTIVAEAVLADKLTRLVLQEGASGYTATACAGHGSRGLRSTVPVGEQNVRIEVLTDLDVADRILARLDIEYFAHYAVVAWCTDAAVVRGSKFSGPGIVKQEPTR